MALSAADVGKHEFFSVDCRGNEGYPYIIILCRPNTFTGYVIRTTDNRNRCMKCTVRYPRVGKVGRGREILARNCDGQHLVIDDILCQLKNQS